MPERPLILVIEDEYLLQADVEKILTEAGFATDILSSGEEALTLLMGGLKRPSALVTDVSLAGRLSGWEVARRIREKDPSFPVIYVTAYGLDWASHGVPNSILISKPFAPAQLITALSQCGQSADSLAPGRNRKALASGEKLGPYFGAFFVLVLGYTVRATHDQAIRSDFLQQQFFCSPTEQVPH
jgi:CheY-like chemotaxis protein